MKKLLLASLVSCAAATPGYAGPDFVASTPRGSWLAASSGSSEIGPLDDVFFERDSARLMPGAADQLTTIARWLRRNPRQMLVLEGHADRSGFDAYNEDLATRRASMVRSHLIARGVPGDRILVITFGENAARESIDSHDRRVVMYATNRPISEIVQKSYDKGAVAAMWERGNAIIEERRKNAFERPLRIIAMRR